MKTSHLVALFAVTAATATAGVVIPGTGSYGDALASARRPITNPTLFDLAVPTTNIHPIFMYQRLPGEVNTAAGRLPMDGHVEVYALQFEIALTERLSLVATKDGYVEFRPDDETLWSKQSGFANIGAGLKYAFLLDPAAGHALSGTVTFEAPTGNRDVFQGEGDGAANLILSGLKLCGPWQFAAGTGAHLPFSDQQSTSAWLSAHVSYEVSPWFIPLVELNWFRVLDPGDGRPAFPSQAGGAVPVVAEFEGGDLLNFGAANADENRDLVTAAIGFRSRLSDSADLGFAYEIPLTNEHDGILKDRVTVDLVWRF